MTTVHVVRGLYIAVSLIVALFAQWRPGIANDRDRIAAAAFAAYAIATAAAQANAFNRPLTLGSVYIGVGVTVGVVWLVSLSVERRKH